MSTPIGPVAAQESPLAHLTRLRNEIATAKNQQAAAATQTAPTQESSPALPADAANALASFRNGLAASGSNTASPAGVHALDESRVAQLLRFDDL